MVHVPPLISRGGTVEGVVFTPSMCLFQSKGLLDHPRDRVLDRCLDDKRTIGLIGPRSVEKVLGKLWNKLS